MSARKVINNCYQQMYVEHARSYPIGFETAVACVTLSDLVAFLCCYEAALIQLKYISGF